MGSQTSQFERVADRGIIAPRRKGSAHLFLPPRAMADENEHYVLTIPYDAAVRDAFHLASKRAAAGMQITPHLRRLPQLTIEP